MRFTFHARQANVHSPLTFFNPRRENCRKPITDLMIPKTGSTVCFRKAYLTTNFRSSRYGGVFAETRKLTPPY